MDFIILKINGQDLTAASHEQVLEVLNSASEPIYVEVARRTISTPPIKKSIPQMTESISNSDYYVPNRSFVNQSHLHSYVTPHQNDKSLNHDLSLNSVPKWQNFYSPDSTKNRALFNAKEFLKFNSISERNSKLCDDEDSVEIIKEEVLLRKTQLHEIFGLTLSYSALSASENSESEVYISAIEPNSVAMREPNIHLGDQILKINNVDVYSKAQVVSLFRECGLEVRLLLGRPNTIPNVGESKIKNETSHFELPPLEEQEYSSLYGEIETNMLNDKHSVQFDKDSGIGRGTDETAKTEESSECDSSQASLRKSRQYPAMDHLNIHNDPAYISKLMQQLAFEYQKLQRMLDNSLEHQISNVAALPPPNIFQTPSRAVPRMGTKLETSQVKSVNTPQITSGSNTSTYSTGGDSTCSSPFSVELCQNLNSVSPLSLKIHNSKFRMDNYRFKNNLSSYSDEKSTSGSSTNNILDTCMMSSGVLNPSGWRSSDVTKFQTEDSGCNYYDVYEPTTKAGNEFSNQAAKIATQNQQNCLKDHDYINAQLMKSDKFENKMEWVVKKRQDGSRYITRRPLKNKMPKEQEKKIDEDYSVVGNNHLNLAINRCLTKSERRAHLDKEKNRKVKQKNNSNIQQSDLSENKHCTSVENYPTSLNIHRKDVNNSSCDITPFLVESTIF